MRLTTREFYNAYWPVNVPDYVKTRTHVLSLLPKNSNVNSAFDGGCGTGVCSLALAEMAAQVFALDQSLASLAVARNLARKCGKTNIEFIGGNLLEIPFVDNSFDLAWSWGVIHHTSAPLKALDELVRITKPGGTLILAVYLRTKLTFLHELVRKACLHLPSPGRKAFIRSLAAVVAIAQNLGKDNNVRDDNPYITSQVEDWFFVPEKHFFTIEEIERCFQQRGLSFELLCAQTGRFKSSSNFIVRGVKCSPKGYSIQY